MHTFMRLLGSCFAAALAAAVMAAPARAADTFLITGSVDGLYPGAMVTLVASVTNPFPFTVRVTTVGATPGDGPCPAAMLTVSGSSAEVVVEPGATGTVPLEVHLDRNAGDACQAATWPIAFSGTAVEASPASASMAVTGVAIGGAAAMGGALMAIGLALRFGARGADG